MMTILSEEVELQKVSSWRCQAQLKAGRYFILKAGKKLGLHL
jgi:hypothetical protein